MYMNVRKINNHMSLALHECTVKVRIIHVVPEKLILSF